MLLEEAILAHYDMGHNFEVLKIAETPNRVTYNIAQHGVNWKPTKFVVDKINKLFQTFKFTTTGRMYAKRGREFARDAEVLTKMLKAYEINKGGSTDLRKYVLSKHLTTHPEFAAHYPAYAMNLQRHKEAQAEAKERAAAKKQAMAQRQPSVRTTAVGPAIKID